MGAVTSCDGPVCGGHDKDADERKKGGKRRRRRSRARSNSTSSTSSTEGGNTMTINKNGEVTIRDGVSPSSGGARRNSRTLIQVQAAPATGRRSSFDASQAQGLNIDIEDNSGIAGQTYRTNTATTNNADMARAVAITVDGIPALTPIPEEKPGTFTPDPYSRPSFRFGRKPSLSQQSSNPSTQRTLVEVEEME